MPSLQYGQLGGSDQMLLFNQQTLTPPASLLGQSSMLNPLSQSSGIISSASSTPTPLGGPLSGTSASPAPPSQSTLIQPSPLHPSLLGSNANNSNSSKPQSPFHPPHNLPHHLVHNSPNCMLFNYEGSILFFLPQIFYHSF